MRKTLVFTTIWLGLATTACAHPIAGLKRGADLQPVTLEEIAREVPPGAVLVLGENHGVGLHRDQHLQVLQALRQAGHKVSVGLEFFPLAFQNQVDRWRGGLMTEADFLTAIGWSGTPFEFYRDQALFPNLGEGSRTLALNASRSLTSRVAKVGLEGLTPAEKAELPPGFQLGRASYRERFLAAMGGGHLPSPEVGDRYFAAQSIWDETMAWAATDFLSKGTGQTLVIVVGEFHVQYGGGLPDRLRARTTAPVFTLSQVDLKELSPEEALEAITPHAKYGPRADFVWAAESSQP